MSKIMRLIFVVYLCVAVTIASDDFYDYIMDDMTDNVAEALSMSKMDVQICFNKTSINITDLMLMDELSYTEQIDVNSQSGLKVGCLFACLLQKKGLMIGTYIDINKVKKIMDTKMRLNAEKTAKRDQILNICIDQVKNTTNECRVMFKLFICLTTEAKHYQNMRNT